MLIVLSINAALSRMPFASAIRTYRRSSRQYCRSPQSTWPVRSQHESTEIQSAIVRVPPIQHIGVHRAERRLRAMHHAARVGFDDLLLETRFARTGSHDLVAPLRRAFVVAGP